MIEIGSPEAFLIPIRGWVCSYIESDISEMFGRIIVVAKRDHIISIKPIDGHPVHAIHLLKLGRLFSKGVASSTMLEMEPDWSVGRRHKKEVF